MRQGRHTADDLPRRHIAGDGGAGRDHRPISDMNMVSHRGLAAEDHARSEARATRQTRLANNDAMRPDRYVVGDLHKVVDFGAVSDSGCAEFSAVDTDA